MTTARNISDADRNRVYTIPLTVHNLWDGIVPKIHRQIRISWRLVSDIHPWNTLDLPRARLCKVTLPVDLFAPFQRCRSVNEEKVAPGTSDGIFDCRSVFLERSNRSCDDCCACFCQFRSYESDSREIQCLFFGRKGNVLVCRGRVGVVRVKLVTEEERDGSTTVLLQDDLKGTGDRVFARVGQTGDENGEALLDTWGVTVSKDLDNALVREPIGDGLSVSGSSYSVSSAHERLILLRPLTAPVLNLDLSSVPEISAVTVPFLTSSTGWYSSKAGI